MVFTCSHAFSKTDGTESETRSQNGKRDTRAKNGKRDTKPRHGNRDTRLKGRREGSGIQAHAFVDGVSRAGDVGLRRRAQHSPRMLW